METIASQLSNDDLVAELNRLAHRERATTVDLIVHLAEFDARGLHLSLGFPSLFASAGKSCGSRSTPPTTGSRLPVRVVSSRPCSRGAGKVR